MTVARQTQEVVEVLSEVDPALRATQVLVEVLSEVTPTCRVSQVVMELITNYVEDDVTGTTQPLLIVVT